MPKKCCKLPHISRTFLHRQGLKIMPSQNFIDKFKEFYLEIHSKNKRVRQIDSIDDDTAIFFIVSVIESIIYCLDFGYGVHLRRVMMINNRRCDYRHNIHTNKVSVVENVVKISFKVASYIYKNAELLLNKNNQAYNDYIELKKDRFKEIKEYYKKFYGKENEWWQ